VLRSDERRLQHRIRRTRLEPRAGDEHLHLLPQQGI
jgi:hypothetical protein